MVGNDKLVKKKIEIIRAIGKYKFLQSKEIVLLFISIRPFLAESNQISNFKFRFFYCYALFTKYNMNNIYRDYIKYKKEKK